MNCGILHTLTPPGSLNQYNNMNNNYFLFSFSQLQMTLWESVISPMISHISLHPPPPYLPNIGILLFILLMQSERFPMYRQHAGDLLSSGHAYHCFCTKERLRSLPQGYDGFCRSLSPCQVQDNLQMGVAHTIRLKVSHCEMCSCGHVLVGTCTCNIPNQPRSIRT